MDNFKAEKICNLEETIAKELLEKSNYAWESLKEIGKYIIEIGNKLDKDKYENVGNNVWIAKNAKIANTTSIIGPAIIDENTEVRHNAFIRENVIIGKNAVVGNSTELKNCILFNNVQVPHFNYVGDSILGYKVHLGAGSIISNLKSDKSEIHIKCESKSINTNLIKFGAIVGDNSEIGCNSVLNPGTIIGKNVTVYPLCSVRGVIPDDSIYKEKNNINKKDKRV